ncbi:MAG: hypothetical protein AAF633_13935 [Chloroflexota bacterium]
MKQRIRLSLFLFLLLLPFAWTQPAHSEPSKETHMLDTQAPVDWRFGIVETYQDPAAANASGAAWTRVRFQWADVQAAGPDSWNPQVSDAQIGGEVASGRLVTGLLIGVPDWANENGLPRGLYLPHSDPNNLWANFVRTAVGRYAGQINHWIIWNEPDVWDKAAPGHTWDGSVQDFYQLQKIAYVTAKETNPNATVHLSAFTYFWDANYGRDQYFAKLLDLMVNDPDAAGNNYFFDVATAHLYFQPGVVYDIIGAFYGMMAGRGIVKPLWLIETNAPPTDDPAWEVPNYTFWVRQDEQAAFIPQVFASAMSAGASRIAIYKMRDLDSDVAANPEPFGLVRRDGSRRPAFSAYQVAVRYMSGVESSRRERWDDVGQFKLNQGSKQTHVLFSRTLGARVVEIEAVANSALLVDMWGNQQTLAAQEGKFVVNLPAAECSQMGGEYCMIGGETFFLVQGVDGGSVAAPPVQSSGGAGGEAEATAELTATEPPTETPTPDPTETSTPTITATHTPEPTSTETTTPSPTATQTPTATPTSTLTATSTPRPTETPEAEAVAAVTDQPAAEPEASSEQAIPPQTERIIALILLGAGTILLLILCLALLLNRKR